MRLTRVFVDAELTAGRLIELPADTASHVAKVLRARGGDALTVFNGRGGEFAGSIETVRGGRVSVALAAEVPVERESPLQLTLLQCVPRGDRMDFIVQKATELGVTRILPILSQRSVVRLDADQAESKAAHWRAVAVSACEQCGRNRLPSIEAPRQLLKVLGDAPPPEGTRLVLEPDDEADEKGWNGAPRMEIAIGPEGGFAPDELEALRVSGFYRVTLGPRILRAETAAIAAVTWLQTRFGDMHA
jgi:16S rRNA (uracil1498-N3)-methyltransferase